jgi:hypothetical protein
MSVPNRDALAARLMSRRLVTPKGCWEWQGARDKDGYGVIKIAGKVKRVPRVADMIWNHKPWDSKALTRHTCDNPACFNPAHLLPGVWKDNSEDATKRGRTVVPKKGANREEPV